MKHAQLQPSRAHRWLACPGSVRAETDAPDTHTEYANRGAALHRLLAQALAEGPLELCPGPIAYEEDGRLVRYEATESDVRRVEAVARYAMGVLQALDGDGGATLNTEVYCRVGRRFGLPEDVLSGHADVVIDSDDELVVVDAKFGWQEVEVESNPQLSLYALGLAQTYGWKHRQYRLVVAQPERGAPREELLSADELRARGDAMWPQVLLAADPDAKRAPGEHCRGCRAAGTCRVFQDYASEHVAAALDQPDGGQDLSPEALGLVLDRAALLRHALEQAEAAAKGLIRLGVEVPGAHGPWKLVAGRGQRHWKDEAEAARLLRVLGLKPYKEVLLSPAQAEELLGAERSGLLTAAAPKVPGRPTLAPGNDKRAALDAAGAFDENTEE